MKFGKNVFLTGILCVLAAYVIPGMAKATHTVESVTPSGAQQTLDSEELDVSIQLGGTVRTPAISPNVLFFKPGGIPLLSSHVNNRSNTSYDVNNPSPFPATVTIPTEAAMGGSYTVRVCYQLVTQVSDKVSSKEDCADKINAFCIGGSCPGGGSGGSGGIEPVPAKFGVVPRGPQSGSELIDLVEGITDWVFVILLVVAVIFILLAALQFISSGGDATQRTEAKDKLLWAAVGIVVALLSRGIPFVIRNVVAG